MGRHLLLIAVFASPTLVGCGATPVLSSERTNAVEVAQPDKKSAKISLGQDRSLCTDDVAYWGNMYKALVKYRNTGSGDSGFSTHLAAVPQFINKLEGPRYQKVQTPELKAGLTAIVNEGQAIKVAFADPAHSKDFEADGLVKAFDQTASACELGGVNISWHA